MFSCLLYVNTTWTYLYETVNTHRRTYITLTFFNGPDKVITNHYGVRHWKCIFKNLV